MAHTKVTKTGTQNTGTANTFSYSGSFNVFKASEVEVELDNVALTFTTSTINESASPREYTVDYDNKTVHVGGANLASSNSVVIQPVTDMGAPTPRATYEPGASVTSEDLNNNQLQLMRKAMEYDEQKLSSRGGTMTGNLHLAKDIDISFEGDTDNAYETTLTVADPTSDKTITFPDTTGTVVTTGDTGTVATAMIANNAINGDKIADTVITTSKLDNNAVTTAKINDAAVTLDKLQAISSGEFLCGNGSNRPHAVSISGDATLSNSGVLNLANAVVNTAELANTAVTTNKITDLNVTTAKIAADAVTNAKIADNAVDADQIVSSAVTTAKINNDAVTNAKIADNAVDADQLVNSAVTTVKINDGAVTTSKLGANAVTNAKIADNSIDSEHYVDGSIDTVHIGGSQVTDAKLASNAVTTTKITDANVTTVKIADSNITLAKLANDLKQTTISDSDTQLPTSGAVVDYVTAQLQPFGGFEAVATEVAFPNTQPVSGVAISISDAGGVVVNGSGVSTTGRTVGGSTVTINGFPSSLYNETLVAGVGLIVTSTGSSQTYNYHKILGKEDDIKQLSDDINDFNARYRVGSSNPTSALDSGDLFFNTGSGKLLVYNGTNSAWEEAQSIGNYYINTISSYSGTGGNSASFNGSAYRFVLSNPGTTAEQHIVSVNGVIQKPNSGTSQPGEGFAIDGSSIIFSSAPATGADFFIITIGSTVNIGTPSDNTVTTAKLTSGAVTTVKIADDAVTGAKIADNLDIPDNNKIRFGTGNDLEIYHNGSNSFITNSTGNLILDPVTNENGVVIRANAAVELYYDNSKKFETTSYGVEITGGLELPDSTGGTTANRLKIGAGDDLQLFHNGTNSIITNSTGDLSIRSDNNIVFMDNGANETFAKFVDDGAVELYYDNSKKLETFSGGVEWHGSLKSETDGDKIALGAANDLQLYHDGTYNVIKGTGNHRMDFYTNGTLRTCIQSDGHLRPASNNTYHLGTSSDRWNQVYAYTTNVSTQMFMPDNGQIRLGTSDDLKLYHNGTNSFIENSTGKIMIQNSDGNIQFEAKNGEDSCKMIPDGAVELYYNNSKKLETTNTGIQVTGNVTPTGYMKLVDGMQLFLGTGNDLQIYHDGSASHVQDNDSNVMRISSDSIALQSGDKTEAGLVFTKNGSVDLYYNNTKKLETTTNGITISGGISGASTISTSNSGDASGTFNRTTSTGTLIELRYNGSNKGYIAVDGSNAQFATSASDRTLKKNFEDWTNSVLPSFKALKPQIFNFTFEEDGDAKHKGYIAQDNIAAFPEAYPKNDDDKYMFNPSGMVHYLMKAVQELSTEVESLKTKVAALEAK